MPVSETKLSLRTTWTVTCRWVQARASASAMSRRSKVYAAMRITPPRGVSSMARRMCAKMRSCAARTPVGSLKRTLAVGRPTLAAAKEAVGRAPALAETTRRRGHRLAAQCCAEHRRGQCRRQTKNHCCRRQSCGSHLDHPIPLGGGFPPRGSTLSPTDAAGTRLRSRLPRESPDARRDRSLGRRPRAGRPASQVLTISGGSGLQPHADGKPRPVIPWRATQPSRRSVALPVRTATVGVALDRGDRAAHGDVDLLHRAVGLAHHPGDPEVGVRRGVGVARVARRCSRSS